MKKKTGQNYKIVNALPDNDFCKQLKSIYDKIVAVGIDMKSVIWDGREKKFEVALIDPNIEESILITKTDTDVTVTFESSKRVFTYKYH